ncbi:type III secretion system chaperone [Bremerella sp. JC770]|uniref:type III secretion system chaperone n=1 Tax=Bremerella sp. JC770 TaxID=3232137 RepID=UPI003459924F
MCLNSIFSETLGVRPKVVDATDYCQAELPSGLPVYAKFYGGRSNLLIAIPMGAMAKGLETTRATTLMIANHGSYAVGGGGLGIQSNTGQIYLTRYFPINSECSFDPQRYRSVAGFCKVAEEFTCPIVAGVNALQVSNESGKLEIPGQPFPEPESGVDGQLSEPKPGHEVVSNASQFLGEALAMNGLSFEGFDSDLAWYLGHENENLMSQVRLDPVSNELELRSLIGEVDPLEGPLDVLQLFSSNYLLGESNHCVLGISEKAPHQITLRLTVPLELMTPDPVCLANVISGFLNNTEAQHQRWFPTNSGQVQQPHLVMKQSMLV